MLSSIVSFLCLRINSAVWYFDIITTELFTDVERSLAELEHTDDLAVFTLFSKITFPVALRIFNELFLDLFGVILSFFKQLCSK